MVPEMVDMEMPVEGVFHNLVIAQIHKEYAGQGQKVMNAMWGAGQMMFNKILVLVDEGCSITDYLNLAKYVFKNLNPSTDIYFSQGPMDVLDHSCSKLGFGGKMCIDGSWKFDEEIRESKNSAELDPSKVFNAIHQALSTFPEIRAANDQLVKTGIPCLILSVKKNRPGHIRQLHQSLLQSVSDLQFLKIILYVEHTVDPNDLATALWRFCNNLDPKRDHILYEEPGSSFNLACMGFDGTIKTSLLDDFKRDWPNIIVADDKTIRAVDNKWTELGIGEFIPSPSLKFKDQMYGEEAVAASPN